MVMVTALVVMSTGSMVVFTVTGSIDTMDSEAAQTLNNTMTVYAVGPVALVIICAVAIVCMMLLSRRAF